MTGQCSVDRAERTMEELASCPDKTSTAKVMYTLKKQNAWLPNIVSL